MFPNFADRMPFKDLKTHGAISSSGHKSSHVRDEQTAITNDRTPTTESVNDEYGRTLNKNQP
jgi:hypothetical protein